MKYNTIIKTGRNTTRKGEKSVTTATPTRVTAAIALRRIESATLFELIVITSP